MTNQEIGIENFRRRLAVEIRDAVLIQLNNPQGISLMSGIPVSELGAISDMTEEDRLSLVTIVARALDGGIRSFLSNLSNKVHGFEIRYNGCILNEEGLCLLSGSENPPICEYSAFDCDGREKEE